MANRMSNPIQQLLAAEKKATIVVNDAKARRTQRMKQAHLEVQQDIDAYKAECDAGLQQQEEEIAKLFESLEKQAEEEIKKELDGVFGIVAKNVDKALQVLLSAVCDIQCELHINYDVEANKPKAEDDDAA